MHIAYITPEYPIEDFKGNVGGIGTFTRNIAENLVKQGLNITIFIYSQQENFIRHQNGVEIHFVKKKELKGGTWLTNRRYFYKYVNAIVLINNIDIVESPEWTGFTAFMRFRCPLVIRLHGSDTYFCDLENRSVKWKNKFFEKKALRAANSIIGVSDFVSKKTKELFRLKNEIKTIHNTIDVTRFSPDHENILHKTLLYFGTLVRKKGVLEIAKMFNLLIEKDNEVSLTLLGKDNIDILTGESTLTLMKRYLSEKAKSKLNYVNYVPYDKVITYIKQAEIILLPSLAEAFPMTWLEAMAMEKKMVTSNIGWANELMIDGQTGFMVTPTDSINFASKVYELIENHSYSMDMAKNARQRIVEKFNDAKSINVNIEFYKKMLNEV